MATTPNRSTITPELGGTLSDGRLRVSLPAGAVSGPAQVGLTADVTPPPLPPDYHLRFAFQLSITDSKSTSVPDPSDPFPHAPFDLPATVTFSCLR